MKVNLLFKGPAFLLLILAFIELLLISKFRSVFGIYITPIIYTIVTLSIGLLLLFKSKYKNYYKESNVTTIIKWLFASNVLIILFWFCYRCFSYYPIDPNSSDVFSQIISASKNILSFRWPYEMVDMGSYRIMPNYLPSFWLPFVISHITHTDERWIPILFWTISILYFIMSLKNYSGIESQLSELNFLKKNYLFSFCSFFIILIFGFYLYVKYNPQEYAQTLEFLPASYYIFLIGSILRKKPLEISLGIALVLTSRFSILFFTPVILYYIYLNQGTSDFKKVIAYLSAILILLLGYFLINDPQLIQKILNNYNVGTFGEWQVQSWQEAGAKPYQLSRGVGLTIYIYDLFIDNVEKGISVLKFVSIFLGVSLCIITMFMLNKMQNRNLTLILLGSLKIYLAVFYALSLVPYTYLMIVPSSVSLVLVLYYLQISNLAETTNT